jgi:hypothetical protein
MSIKSTRAAFSARQELDRPTDAGTAAAIVAWSRKRNLAVRWTSATDTESMTGSLRLGVQEHKLLTLQTNGLVWVLVTQLSARLPFVDPAAKTQLIDDLRTRLLEFPRAGQSASGKGAKIAFRLEDLRTSDTLGKFFVTLEWLIARLQTGFDTMRVGGVRGGRRPSGATRLKAEAVG